MDAVRRAVAGDILVDSRKHDARQSDRRTRFRNVEPDTAELLGVLVRVAQATRVLELGTSNGYSTIWLADAVESLGGTVTTVDIDAARIELARANLELAGLLHVDLRTADAALVLAESASEAWDLVFLDAERTDYLDYWPNLLRALRPGGLLVVDNVLSHANEVAPFLALVSVEPVVTTAPVPIGAGIQLIVKNG